MCSENRANTHMHRPSGWSMVPLAPGVQSSAKLPSHLRTFHLPINPAVINMPFPLFFICPSCLSTSGSSHPLSFPHVLLSCLNVVQPLTTRANVNSNCSAALKSLKTLSSFFPPLDLFFGSCSLFFRLSVSATCSAGHT